MNDKLKRRIKQSLNESGSVLDWIHLETIFDGIVSDLKHGSSSQTLQTKSSGNSITVTYRGSKLVFTKDGTWKIL